MSYPRLFSAYVEALQSVLEATHATTLLVVADGSVSSAAAAMVCALMGVQVEAVRVDHGDSLGTHFPCFTSTKVQILTQKPLLASRLFAFMYEEDTFTSSSSYASSSSRTQTRRLEAIEQERDALRAKTESLQKEYDKLWNAVKNMVQIGQAAITRAV